MVVDRRPGPNDELYLQIAQQSQAAFEAHSPLVAEGEWTRQQQTSMAYSEGSVVPIGVSLEEFAARFDIDTMQIPLPILEREMLRRRLRGLNGTVEQFLWGAEADFLATHVREGHRIRIVGRVLTRLATDTQNGGSISMIDLFRDEETRPAISALSIMRELPDNSTENAGFVVSEEGHLLDADSRKISPLMQRAIDECKSLFGAGSEPYRALAYPPEDLDAAFARIRASVEGILPPEEVGETLEHMRSALEEQRSNPETAEEETARLQRISSFVLSMSS